MIAGTGNFEGNEIKECSGRAVHQVVTEAVQHSLKVTRLLWISILIVIIRYPVTQSKLR